MDSIQGTRSRIRRRSQRIPLAVPLVISSLDPNTPYGEHGESIAVSSHGCCVRAPKPLNPGTPVRLDIMHTDRTTTAHVVRSEAGKDEKTWEIALELDKAENFWGIRFPPEDWAGGLEARARERSADATASAPTAVPEPPRAADTVAARPVRVPPPPPASASPPTVEPVSGEQMVRELEPALREKAKEISAEFEDSYRKSLGDLLVRLRADFEQQVAGDWERVRSEANQKLQHTAGEFRQQLQQELDHWRRDAAAVDEKLAQLAELRTRLGQELQARQPAENLEAQLEDVRQARDYIESLIRLLPQTVEQQLQEGLAAVLERTQVRIESEFSTQRENELEQVERRLIAAGEQVGDDLRQKLLEDFARQEREFLDRVQVRLEEARALEGGFREHGNQLTAELTRQAEQVVGTIQAQCEAALRGRQREFVEQLERQFAELSQRAETAIGNLGEDTWNSLQRRLQEKFSERQLELERVLEAASAEAARLQERAEKLAARLDGGMEEAIEAVVERARQRLEQAGETTRDVQVARLQAQVEFTLQPLVNSGESVAEELRLRLAELREDRSRLESLAAEFKQEAAQAQAWLTRESQGFEKAIETALIEATGQIKGRVAQGVEMAQKPLERRVAELRAQLEELAAAKTEELRQQLEHTRQRLQAYQAEVEASASGRLNTRLTEVVEQFRQQAEAVSEKATAQVQATLNETLESIARVFREKFGRTP